VSYRLFYTARAERDMAKLDPGVKERIRQALERYARDPFRHVRKMVSPELGMYRFRIGDWRVICDIYEDCIVVLRVGHRREIYRG
jgi:mRNA interferase RelE/StbE